MEKELESLIDKYSYRRLDLGHQIVTATRLGYHLEVKHLQEMRAQVEDCYYDIKSIQEKYQKEKLTPNPAL